MTVIWVDGQPQCTLNVMDRGLAYGDGLFETIALRHGQLQRWPRHKARLVRACQRLFLALDLSVLEAELNRFITTCADGVVKVVVTRGAGQRGYALPVPATTTRILQWSPVPAYPTAHQTSGIELFPCATRLAEQPLLAGIKHLNRLEQVLARAEWSDTRFAEGLVRDTSGRVVEGVFSNLFIVCAGELMTADLSRCGVDGVMRQTLLDLAVALNIPNRVLDIDDRVWLQAEEVFMCNSQYGIWPVIACAGRSWEIGPVTRQLITHLSSAD